MPDFEEGGGGVLSLLLRFPDGGRQRFVLAKRVHWEFLSKTVNR
jgi:hypothetical protein